VPPRRRPTWGTNSEKEEKDMSFLAEFWKFLRVRKKFWLLPLLTIIVLFGVLLILAESSAMAPFIYTLF
jgi:hypothetical protein